MKNKISKRKVEFIFGKRISKMVLIINEECYEMLDEFDVSKYKGKENIKIRYEFVDGTSYTTKEYKNKIVNNRSILLHRKPWVDPIGAPGIFMALIAPFVYLLANHIQFLNPEYFWVYEVVLALIPVIYLFRRNESINDYFVFIKITTKNYSASIYDGMSEADFNLIFESKVKKLKKRAQS